MNGAERNKIRSKFAGAPQLLGGGLNAADVDNLPVDVSTEMIAKQISQRGRWSLLILSLHHYSK